MKTKIQKKLSRSAALIASPPACYAQYRGDMDPGTVGLQLELLLQEFGLLESSSGGGGFLAAFYSTI